MLLQKLASLLCEDDHVLHDVDRSGVDDPDNTVSGAKFQKQTAFQVELFSIGLIFSTTVRHQDEDFHHVRTDVFIMYWTAVDRMPYAVLFLVRTGCLLSI